MNNDGTPVFNDEISLKMPKKKQDTTINPAMVFEGYKAPPETEKQKVVLVYSSLLLWL